MAAMQTIGARQASNRFGSLLNTVQTGETVTITRNDRETAVLISPTDFKLLGGEQVLLKRRSQHLEKKRQELLGSYDAMQKEAEKNGLNQDVLNSIINDG